MLSMMSFAFLLLCFLVRTGDANDYQTFYFESFCTSSETKRLHLGSENANSSGIIQASKKETFLPNRNCTLWISPSLDYGVVLSIRKLDISPFGQKDCKNYVRITGKQDPIGLEEDDNQSVLCVYSDDSREQRSYVTSGPMQILLHTASPAEEHSKLTFIVTSFMKRASECPPNTFQCNNDRCIWKGLTCDGHNNCGDRSDEDNSPFSRSQCRAWVIIVITVGAVIGACVLIATATVVWYRWRSRRREEEEEEEDEEEEHRSLLHPGRSRNTGMGGSVQYRDVGPTTSHYGTTERENSPPPPYHTL